MRVRRKKNGFTLVELLVTIALMLSLLGIAIVSFIKISDSRKQDAYKLVEDQIFTAAEQYLESNSYRFEGYSDDIRVEIDLGTLIEEDYLNVVTSPITGKKLSKCGKIILEKKAGRLRAVSFEDDTKNLCSPKSSYFAISTLGAPDLNHSFLKYDNVNDEKEPVKEDDASGWFNKKSLMFSDNSSIGTLAVHLIGKSDIPVILEVCKNPGKKCDNYKKLEEVIPNDKKIYSYDDVSTFKEDGEKIYMYRVKSDRGVKEIEVSAGVDTKSPVIAFTKSKEFPTTWSNTYSEKNGGLRVDAAVTDETSKIKSITKYHNKDGLLGPDKDGANILVSNNASYNSDMSGGNAVFDLQNYKDGYKIIKVKACDKAGNCSENSVTALKDTTPPTINFDYKLSDAVKNSVSISSDKTEITSWINSSFGEKDIALYPKVSDSLSKLNVAYRHIDSENKASYNENSINDTANDTYDLNGFGSNTDAKQPMGTAVSNWRNGYRMGKYVACDKAGNCAEKIFKFKIDKTAPTIQFAYKRKKKEEADTSYSSITNLPTGWSNLYKSYDYKTYITINDSLSKIKTTNKYQNANGLKSSSDGAATISMASWTNRNSYTSSHEVNVSNYQDGDKRIRFYACDYAGNCSSNTIAAKIDTTPPKSVSSETRENNSNGKTVTFLNSTSWRKGVYWWGNFSSEDSLSGTDHYEYSRDGKSKVNNLENSYTYGSNNTDRNSTYYFRAVDKVGNASSWVGPYNFKIDNTPPKDYTLNIAASNAKSYLKDVRQVTAASGYDITYNITKCGDGALVYATSCEDNLSGTDSSTRYVKWTLNNGYYSTNSNYKRFTNYIKVGTNWRIRTKDDDDGSNPWMTIANYNTQTGSDTYRFNYKNINGITDGTYVVKYSRKCKDKAGNWSKNTLIRIYAGTDCSN